MVAPANHPDSRGADHWPRLPIALDAVSLESLSDLLLFEMDEAPGVPLDDVVGRYIAILGEGTEPL